ncbi:MAG: zinc ribbon domain-containing protein [Planctomycetota bacterium]|jgi:predicted  nucleic acid-binding Zn-ribbon protein
MTSATGGLKELHELHLQVAEVEKRLAAGPRQVLVREKLVEKKQAEIAAHKDKLTAMQKAADQKNLQFKTNEQHIIDLKAKLNQAASNKEFDIIKGQIEAANSSNATLEDEYLEALEEIDAARTQHAELEEQLKTAQANIESMKQEVAAEKPKLEARLAELKTAISESEGCVPNAMREDYRRMALAKGASCLSSVENYACLECYVEVSPQQKVELRAAKPTKCRSCGRLLYMDAHE